MSARGNLRVARFAFLTLAVAPVPLFAIGGDPASINNDDHPFVGRVNIGLVSDTLFYNCSGSLIQPNPDFRPYVLTAAHCTNYVQLPELPNNGGTPGLIRPRFERFTYTDGFFYGLGVPHPKFSSQPDNFKFSSDLGDVALIILLNGQTPATVGVITSDAENAGDLADADIVGFTGAPPGNVALRGKATLDSTPTDTITYYNPPSKTFIQPGDSGGPTFQKFTIDAKQVELISGVHSGSFKKTVEGTKDGFFDVRVNAYRSFVIGDGEAGTGKAALIRLRANTGNENWNTANLWRLGSANTPTAQPGTDQVAILDPTNDCCVPDSAANHILVDLQTNALEGLLNDVTLDVDNGNLRVRGNTGGLNGGVINVGGGNNLSFVNINHSLDNVGTIHIGRLGIMDLGASLSQLDANIGLWNTTRSAGDGITVAGGTLKVSNGNGQAVFRNFNQAMLTVMGAPGGQQGTATIDFLSNDGEVHVEPLGLLDATNGLFNDGRGIIRVTGVPGGGLPRVANVRASLVTNGIANAPAGSGGLIEINDGGEFDVNFNGAFPITPFQAYNQAQGRIVVNPGGLMTVQGGVSNAAKVEIHSDARQGTMLILPIVQANAIGGFLNERPGTLELDDQIPILFPISLPEMELQNSTFLNRGAIKGAGQIFLRGAASFIHDHNGGFGVTDNNMHRIDLIFLGAVGKMEAGSEDSGAAPAPNADPPEGLDQPLAMNRLCIAQFSSIKLTDNFFSEDPNGGEVIYTRYIGVEVGSTLDLNGINLYYEFLDPACGLAKGNIIGRELHLIQIPEPASISLLAFAALAMARRRRPGFVAGDATSKI